MQFIADLNESRLLPTYTHLKKFKAKQIVELVYLYLCAINILAHEDETRTWVQTYCRRTIQFGNFSLKRTTATDLYVMLYAVLGDNPEFRNEEESEFFIDHMRLDMTTLLAYLKGIAYERPSRPAARLLFTNLDRRFNVKDANLHAIRRLAMDWPTLDTYDKKLCLTRLLQVLRHRALRSELLPFLASIARHRHFDLDDACDPETGIDCTESAPSLLRELEGIPDLIETSSAGATGAANVATSIGGLGAGFDPEGDFGIYPKPKQVKKPVVIRRVL